VKMAASVISHTFRRRFSPSSVRTVGRRAGRRVNNYRQYWHEVFKGKDIPKNDPIKDPFRAYKDPKYYSKLMAEPFTRAKGWQEVFDIYLYLKEGRWNIFDVFIGAMCTTCVLWRCAYEPWMREHFTYCPAQLDQGKWYTAFTSLISHSGKFHLFANSFLILCCVHMLRPAANTNLLFLTFIAACQAGNLAAHLRENRNIPQHGASAGTCALMVMTALYLPWKTMNVYFPGGRSWHRNFLWRVVLLGMVSDFGFMFYKEKRVIAHDAHLAGYGTGLVLGCALKKYHTGVKVNHLWRKPVLSQMPRPKLWDTKQWDKMSALGRDGFSDKQMGNTY